MNWKEYFKQFPLIYTLNAHIKCFQMKRRLKAWKRHYNAMAKKIGYRYSEEQAISVFKKRLRELQPAFVPRSIGELRIFWVGASQSQDETGFLQSLNRIGRVTVFHNLEGTYGPLGNATPLPPGKTWLEIRAANDQALLQRIAEAQTKYGIDLLIGQMWGHLYSTESLQNVRSQGIPVINISMDDRLSNLWGWVNGVRIGAIGLAHGVDMVLTTSPEVCGYYGLEGCPAIFWPLASDADIFFPKDDARNIDVLFIGNRYGIRGKIVEYLEKRGVFITCYGNGWPNGYVNAEENAALSKRAQIILGVGTVGHCSDVYTLKLRDFDALITGALYITHRNPDLLKLFEEGKEIECYETPAEAYAKISYYLKNADKRRRISRAGQKAAIARHSWDRRLNDTFSRLGLLK